MRAFSLAMASIGLTCGLLAFLFGTTKSIEFVANGGASLSVASLALVGVTAGITTWRDDRQAKLVEERQRASAEMLLQLMARFANGYDPDAEVRRRSDLAIWGEAEVVAQLAAWNALLDKHVPQEVIGQVRLSEEARREFQQATAEVARAIRRQFDRKDDTGVDTLAGALFNRAPGQAGRGPRSTR